MPITCVNVTNIAHDDHRIEAQLLDETGRKMVLDANWATLSAGAHTFLYETEVEFILVKTNTNVEFRRILPVNAEERLGSINWDDQNGEQYYIFKIDPAQKVIVTGSLIVRFIRCSYDEALSMDDDVSTKTPLWKREKRGRPWEAEDVYQKRDEEADETFPPEHLAEAGRRYSAWRAMSKNSLFVYLMVPEALSDRELESLREGGINLVEDVPWVL